MILVIIVISCESKHDRNFEKVESVPAAPVNSDQSENSQTESRSFIIKTANYKFQVENVDSSTKRMERLVPLYQAFVADMNFVTTSSEISNNLVLRVPSQNFEELIEAIGKDALFTNFKRISGDDVTEEFVDIESRLKTKKEVKDRYVDILKNKAKTVEDVLKAEDKIRVLQEEIEAKEGRLKFLQSKVSMSTINLEIYQQVDYKETPDTYEIAFVIKAKQGLSNGWNIVTTLTLFLINIWPIVIVAALIYWKRSWIRVKLTRD